MGANVNNTSNNLKDPNQTENMNIKSGISPQSIGSLKMPKARNTTLILFIYLAAFIAIVVFLPDIYSYIHNIDPNILKNGGGSTSSVILVNNNDQYFDVTSSNNKIIVDNVVFNNFVLKPTSKTMEYKITNNNNKSISVSDLNLYLVVYNDAKTILGTYEITGLIIKPTTSMDSFTKITTSSINDIKYYRVVKNAEVQIDEISLTPTTDGYEYLTCSLNEEIYTYYFIDSQLKKVNYLYQKTYTDANQFALDAENFTAKKELYRSADGFTDNVILYTNDVDKLIRFSSDINLESDKITDIGDDLLLSAGVQAKNVNFTIESKGYDCK